MLIFDLLLKNKSNIKSRLLSYFKLEFYLNHRSYLNNNNKIQLQNFRFFFKYYSSNSIFFDVFQL